MRCAFRTTYDGCDPASVDLCFLHEARFSEGRYSTRGYRYAHFRRDPADVIVRSFIREYPNATHTLNSSSVLEKLQEVGQESSIKLSDVMRICAECGMAGTAQEPLEDQVMAMLDRFNNLGQLMYHKDASLRELVILDPVNFLVTPATRVICEHGMHENEFLRYLSFRHGCLILTPLVLS